MAVKDNSFYGELSRLKKGIRVAWFINFAILFFTIEAGLVFAFLDSHSTTPVILSFLMKTSVIAVIASALIMWVVSTQSRKVLMGAAGNDLKLVAHDDRIYHIVEECSLAAGLERVPEVYLADQPGVRNAYAISDGSGASRVVVTRDLSRMMTRDELAGVIAHEIGHIVSGDSAAMTKLVALTSTVSIVAGVGTRMMGLGGRGRSDSSSGGGVNPLAIVLIVMSLLFLIVSPLLSHVARAYMSRDRESNADALSVKFTRNPTALATALIKLDGAGANDRKDADAVKEFQSKVGDLAFYASPLSSALDTHPPTSERVAKLVSMGAVIR